MEDAINADIKSQTGFIISNEYERKKGGIGRYFTLFPSFQQFLDNRDNYPHCHEIIIDHKNATPDAKGRLVFDFDISKEYTLPKRFKRQVEKTIKRVSRKYYIDIDTDRFDFIWSTSPNDNKTSKHLTVKNLYFEDWISMSITFYKLFCKHWDKRYDWIPSHHLIDNQIARKRAALRMVGSSKIGGNCLVLDNPDHKLTDSLIRIYQENKREKEQLVKKSQMIHDFFDDIKHHNNPGECRVIDLTGSFPEKEQYEQDIYEKALTILEKFCPGTFDMRQTRGDTIVLNRIAPNKCIQSNKYHENEHAYLWIRDDVCRFSVYFRCFRSCGEKRYRYLGYIDSFTGIVDICLPKDGLKIDNVR